VKRVSRAIVWAGLESLYFSGGHRVARRFLSGIGAILTMHRVRPPLPAGFQPNRSLEITPEFLDEMIVRLRRSGADLVSMDEAVARIKAGNSSSRFVALTFDDGYRDNLEHAWPVLKRHNVPFTLYLPSSFADGKGDLWWIALERAVTALPSIEVTIAGEALRFDCADDAAKEETFRAVYWRLRAIGDESEMRAIIAGLAAKAGIDAAAICAAECMGWDEVRRLAADRLCTIGAHTDRHIMLAKAGANEARAEMLRGAGRIAAMLGPKPRHFAFPVGDPTSAGPRDFALAAELGFDSAVTTRAGVLFPDHARHLHALPRISVNGDFQRLRYLDVLLSGAPTYVMNGFRRVNAA